MTDEEAIKWFEAFQNNLISKFDIDDERFSDALKASEVAIKALEKQIPKRPKWRSNGPLSFMVTECCTICGSTNYDKYCSNCGQRIIKVTPV